MIQDIAPNVFHNEFHDRQPQGHEHVLVYDGGQALTGYDEDGRLVFPTVDDFNGVEIKYTYLFSVDNEKYFLNNGFSSKEKIKEKGYGCFSLREIRAFKTGCKDKVFAAYTAFHLWKWYEDNKFCGRCGAALVHDSTEISGRLISIYFSKS